MAESAYTKGPWTLPGDVFDELDNPCVVESNLHLAVASVLDEAGPQEVVLANARLIAAAPDLVEVLQRLENATTTSINARDAADALSWVRAVANTALSRALGKEG